VCEASPGKGQLPLAASHLQGRLHSRPAIKVSASKLEFRAFHHTEGRDMVDGKPAEVEALSEAATAEYLRRSSLTFLECAISLMASHMSMAEVAEILRQEAI